VSGFESGTFCHVEENGKRISTVPGDTDVRCVLCNANASAGIHMQATLLIHETLFGSVRTPP